MVVDFYILSVTTIIGLALVACGVMGGRYYWMMRGSARTLEMLIKENYIRYHLVNGEHELIKLDNEHKSD